MAKGKVKIINDLKITKTIIIHYSNPLKVYYYKCLFCNEELKSTILHSFNYHYNVINHFKFEEVLKCKKRK